MTLAPICPTDSDWLEYDGRIVSIDGNDHRIVARENRRTYPTAGYYYTVHAECVDKTAEWYRTRRAELGGDFCTDILGSDVELECDVWRQLTA